MKTEKANKLSLVRRRCPDLSPFFHRTIHFKSELHAPVRTGEGKRLVKFVFLQSSRPHDPDRELFPGMKCNSSSGKTT